MTRVLLGALVLSGCLTTTEGELRTRAAFDFSCPKEKLQLTPLDGSTVGVEGCGRKATYIRNQDQGIWVMNTDITQAKAH